MDERQKELERREQAMRGMEEQRKELERREQAMRDRETQIEKPDVNPTAPSEPVEPKKDNTFIPPAF